MVYEMYGALFCRVPIRVIKMSIFSLYINWLKQKILDCSSAPETLVCVKHSVKHCSHNGFTNKTLNSGMYKKWSAGEILQPHRYAKQVVNSSPPHVALMWRFPFLLKVQYKYYMFLRRLRRLCVSKIDFDLSKLPVLFIQRTMMRIATTAVSKFQVTSNENNLR